MGNPINESGTKLEDEVESFLKSNNFSFRKQKPGAPEIDFIIPTNRNRSIFADCTNQNGTGSVYDKVPHKVWKYWEKYEYDEVYIIRGTELPPKAVKKHLQWFEKVTGVNTHIISFEEFCNILLNQTPCPSLEEFFT